MFKIGHLFRNAIILTSFNALFIVPAYAEINSAVVINNTSDNNPVYLCVDHNNTTATNPLNLSPAGQAWLDRNNPGKIAYNFSLQSCPDNPNAAQKAAFFSYAGANADSQSSYVYSGQGKDPGFPFYIQATVSNQDCPAGANSCLQISLDPTYQMPADPSSYTTIPYRGVNMPGFEFGQKAGDMWLAPLTMDSIYFVNKGMNTIRLPIQLIYLQPDPKGAINSDYYNQINDYIAYATAHHIYVILDIHNYMRYNYPDSSDNNDSGHIIDSAHPDYLQGYINAASFLAQNYKNNKYTIFELMNEPHDMDTQEILNSENKAIAAIRNTGAKNLILISGNDWSHLNSWVTPQYSYGKINASVFLPRSDANPKGIDDPANNFAIDAHEYFSPGAGFDPTYLNQFMQWLRDNNMKGFIGEIGIDRNDATAIQSADNFITELEQNGDVIIGWSIWSGGSRLPDNQSIFPTAVPQFKEAASMNAVNRHLMSPLS